MKDQHKNPFPPGVYEAEFGGCVYYDRDPIPNWTIAFTIEKDDLKSRGTFHVCAKYWDKVLKWPDYFFVRVKEKGIVEMFTDKNGDCPKISLIFYR